MVTDPAGENNCVYTLWGKYDFVVCGHAAGYLVGGSSYCKDHIKDVLIGRTWSETEKGNRDHIFSLIENENSTKTNRYY